MSNMPGGSTPVPLKVLDIIYGYYGSQSLVTACELGIFDTLADDPPMSAKTLAQQLRTNEDATTRLLDVLVSLDLLKCTSEAGSERLYTNTANAECLTKKSSTCFVNRVIQQPMEVPFVQCLTNAVREGTNRWKEVLNLSGDEIFEYTYHSPERVMKFMRLMRGIIKPIAPKFVSCFDLNGFKQMCDLGGGTGDVAYAASNAYPEMKITVLDLAQVVNLSPQFAPTLQECPNQSNVTFVVGDMFEPALPAADLYVLTHVIHNWGEEKINTLLSKIFNHLPSGGAVLIGESHLNDDKSGPLVAQYISLLMLLLYETGQGARERSGIEYKEMLEKHGFKDVQIKNTGTSITDAVIAFKP